MKLAVHSLLVDKLLSSLFCFFSPFACCSWLTFSKRNKKSLHYRQLWVTLHGPWELASGPPKDGDTLSLMCWLSLSSWAVSTLRPSWVVLCSDAASSVNTLSLPLSLLHFLLWTRLWSDEYVVHGINSLPWGAQLLTVPAHPTSAVQHPQPHTPGLLLTRGSSEASLFSNVVLLPNRLLPPIGLLENGNTDRA